MAGATALEAAAVGWVAADQLPRGVGYWFSHQGAEAAFAEAGLADRLQSG